MNDEDFLAKELNIAPLEFPKESNNSNLPTVVDKNDDLKTCVETDSNYARENYYKLIEKGEQSIDSIYKIAKESMHPRAFEVLAQLLKTQSDNVDKLMKLQKEKKEIIGKSTNTGGNVSVDKAIFVGSTSELLKQIKDSSI